MKKTILLLTLCLSFGMVFTSCKGEGKKEEATETHESHAAEKADIAMNDVYQCPMDCEKGKTYDEEGKCPVCEMDMKKVEKKEEGAHEDENEKKHEDHGGSEGGGGEEKSENEH